MLRLLLEIPCHIMTEISCGENTMAVFICHQFTSISSNVIFENLLEAVSLMLLANSLLQEIFIPWD